MQRAGEEGRKVAEVAFINLLNDQLTEEDKKLSLQQKQEEWEARMRSVPVASLSVGVVWRVGLGQCLLHL